MRRPACALLLAALLLLGTGCRAGSAPGGGGSDQQVSDVESTLDAIESEMAGD